MKTQSAAQQKQLQYMLPHLCQWAGDTLAPGALIDLSDESKREAGRRRAAPHIKTYIRFSNADMNTIDWAMVSSANLSTQAWGAATNGNGEVRICSWEIGVVVWPELFQSDQMASPDGKSDGQSDAVIVPCFKEDTPRLSGDEKDVVVGFRMPYDLPLTSYGASDEPWCATAEYELPDWRGQRWN
jgi:tyrosyl-DNA phosphodiesterase-1